MSYHLQIFPKELGDLGSVHVPEAWIEKDAVKADKLKKERAEAMRLEILRHVSNVDSVYVIKDE